MPSYAYRAVRPSGKISSGTLAASNENELAFSLKECGLELIDAREKKKKNIPLPFLRKKIPTRLLANICSQIRDMLRAGLPFTETLREIRLSTDNVVLADTFEQIGHAIDQGNSISTAFALFPNFFSSIFIALVEAGEKSGSLDESFHYLSQLLTNNAAIRERLLRALRYPAFLFCIAGGAIAFLMVAVIPQIVLFITDIGSSLPLVTRILIGLSSCLTAYGSFVLSGLGVFALLIVSGIHLHPPFAIAFDRLLIKMPFIGSTLLKTEIARFSQNFALLYKSGYPAVTCLAHSRDAFGNRALRRIVYDAERMVSEGVTLSAALQDIMPPYATAILRIGERSGSLEKSLNDIRTTYEREAAEAMDSFIGILEPGLTLALGGLLACTVLAVFGPLYDSLSVLGGKM